MNWYYAANGQQVGPLTETDFQAAVAAGKVLPATLVWHDGMGDWQAYGTLAGATTGAPPVATVTCSECGRSFPADAVINVGNARVCAVCKPVFLQKLKEGGTARGELRYAGFGVRFGAKIIDSIILGVGAMVVLVPLMFFVQSRGAAGGSTEAAEMLALGVQVVFQIVWVAISAVYTIFFLGKYGATPGKMACKIKVVTPDGGPLTYGRACGRFFGDMLSAIICYIGYLMVAFDKEERRALHDRICNTRVIHR
jgi:uncharacterized RDD family membrane protein YckC